MKLIKKTPNPIGTLQGGWGTRLKVGEARERRVGHPAYRVMS